MEKLNPTHKHLLPYFVGYLQAGNNFDLHILQVDLKLSTSNITLVKVEKKTKGWYEVTKMDMSIRKVMESMILDRIDWRNRTNVVDPI